MSGSDGKTALITGGMGGVGKAIATRMAEDGFRVGILYRTHSKDEVDDFLSSLHGVGHGAFCADFRDTDSVRDAVDQYLQTYGSVSICVHAAAAPLTRKKIVDLSEEELFADFYPSVFGAAILFQAVGRSMKERRSGVLIGITTAALGQNIQSGAMGAYLPAKCALRGLLRGLAYELGPAGIRVHAVAPGFMRTPMNADIPERIDEFLLEKSPLKRMITPLDVANVVRFLCSDEASSLTGLSIDVAAGESISL